MSDKIIKNQESALAAMKALMEESARLQGNVERHIRHTRVQLDAMEQSLLKAQKANEDLKREMQKFGILPTDR